jgi:hypothetical protein
VQLHLFVKQKIAVGSFHCVRLTSARLPVREDAHVFAVNCRLNERLDLFENICLGTLRPEHAVKVESQHFFVSLELETDGQLNTILNTDAVHVLIVG